MSQAPSQRVPPLRSPAAWAILLTCTLLGLAGDLWSKHAAFEHIAEVPVEVHRDDVLGAEHLSTLIPRHEPIVVVPGMLDFTLVLNPGAVFGIGAGKRWLFVTFTGIAIVMGLWMFARWTHRGDSLAHACLGLVFAGGLGNLYDRITFGCVRDFIHPLPGLTLGSWEVWPYVSNVADKLLIVGIAGLMWHLWRVPDHVPVLPEHDKPEHDEPKPDEPKPDESKPDEPDPATESEQGSAD